MPTRNINLTNQLDRFVEKRINSGRYGNASEVIREGLRLLEERERETKAKLEWLRTAVQEGLDDLDSGHSVELDTGRELDAHLKHLAKIASRSLVRKIG
jgi:antitoxin ParD1/3/4